MPLPFLPAFIIGGDIVDLVRETGPVAQAVLVLLLAFSVVSWSIILSKWSALRRARVQSGRFLRAFRRAQKLQDIAAFSEQYRPSPLIFVFQAGFKEYERQVGSTGVLRNPLAVQRAMQIASSEQMTRFERNLPWLAIGAVGFVSVVGHVVGDRLHEMIDAYGAGDVGTALAIHRNLLPVYTGLFRNQGVIMTKAALGLLGLPAGPVRPPLADATAAEVEKLREDLTAGGVKLQGAA